jgi:hypothetical protein
MGEMDLATGLQNQECLFDSGWCLIGVVWSAISGLDITVQDHTLTLEDRRIAVCRTCLLNRPG